MSCSWLDTPAGESALFSAIAQFRPVGVHRHAHLLAVILHLRAAASTSPEPESTHAIEELDRAGPSALWAKLRKYYDLDALEAIDDTMASDPHRFTQRTVPDHLARPPARGLAAGSRSSSRPRRGTAAAALVASAAANNVTNCTECDAQPAPGFDLLYYPSILPLVEARAQAPDSDSRGATPTPTNASTPAADERTDHEADDEGDPGNEHPSDQDEQEERDGDAKPGQGEGGYEAQDDGEDQESTGTTTTTTRSKRKASSRTSVRGGGKRRQASRPSKSKSPALSAEEQRSSVAPEERLSDAEETIPRPSTRASTRSQTKPRRSTRKA